MEQIERPLEVDIFKAIADIPELTLESVIGIAKRFPHNRGEGETETEFKERLSGYYMCED